MPAVVCYIEKNTYCKSGVVIDSIEKSGVKPARSRRCKEEVCCINVTVPYEHGKALQTDESEPEELPD
jgi:hypothetical protein